MIKRLFLPVLTCFLLTACVAPTIHQDNPDLAALFERYYQERMQLVPIESTLNGESLNNDKLYPYFTDSYSRKLTHFFMHYRSAIQQFNPKQLSPTDQLSYAIFIREMDMSLQGLSVGYFNGYFQDHQYMPFTQNGGVPLLMGQFGSGSGAQPFKTVKDYEDWQKRATAFSAWADSAIVYFRKGMAAHIVLPAVLVKKMIPQLDAMLIRDATKSLFYGPIHQLPINFCETDKKRLTNAYVRLINQQLVPSYKKLSYFLTTEYLPNARQTTGIEALPHGKKHYSFLVAYHTTTRQTPDEIYQIGLSEVKRIQQAMDSVQQTLGYRGSQQAFFQYMLTDKTFMPFTKPQDVLTTYRAIQARIDPRLKTMFNHVPKASFEVRQTEAFRAASGGPEYVPGTPDGKRPGIFYVPILDAKTYNVTIGMEALFLHEAIPGHHYQIGLQMENEQLPTFRRFINFSAYGEGWALYAETLGKDLGVYTDPYQYLGALVKEMHRAVRLVVDVGMHTKGMSREQAIRYMMAHEPLSEAGATAEIERYMAIPGQALSYKIGQLKIRQLRTAYEQQLGKHFQLGAFHDELLGGGSIPLEILDKQLATWAKGQLN
ncbi:DUF885 domain-containing protein [Spirosoma pollinicola]|uniref:DUF885 domain-containing protein n=1 Tax=Spirosoma pollinicola TaxID=2057025 RepID=A0A2K8Z7V4_9BACT|nr:DUF885 domain-containing protein [Spirosoma pollinicola]AUD05930.1 DUF885 domain-containing protein [Spirosoma pollinicola]